MMEFSSLVVLASGERRRMRVRAPTPEEAQRRLESEGAVVLGMRTVRLPSRLQNRAAHHLAFMRALASLLSAGLTLPEALRTAVDLLPHSSRAPFQDAADEVRSGRGLADALRMTGAGPVHVSIIAAGEVSGDLAGACTRVTAHLEREAQLRARLLSASVYPAILALTAMITVASMVLFVLPRFAELIAGAGGQLPPLVGLLIALSNLIRGNLALVVVAMLTGVTMATGFMRHPRGRLVLASAATHMPLIGPVRSCSAAAGFMRNLGTMLEGGTPIVEALDRAAVNDPAHSLAIAEARDSVRAGRTLLDAVAAMPFIPQLALQMIGAGERAGDLASHVLTAADLLEQDVERRVARMLTMLEPVLILLLGGIVGLTALGLLQAVYGLHAGSFR